jgi:integrase
MAIKKLSNKKYKIRVSKYINGLKKERKFTGILPTMGDAKAKERELLQVLSELKDKEENESLRYTWRKALDDYFEHSEEEHRLSTYYNRLKVLEAHTVVWNELELLDIMKINIKTLIDTLSCSNSHKKEVLKYIRQVFDLAVDNRKLNNNPTKNIKIHGDKNYRNKANKLEAMTKDEVVTVLNYMEEIEHNWYDIFAITYLLGLRSSEAVALEFEDIDWSTNQIIISKSWCKKKKGFVPPKNGTSRRIPINNDLKLILKRLLLQNGREGFVLPRIKSWINGGATKILQKIQSDLDIKNTNYHSLRASFITHLLLDGMSVVKVQVLVGHAELSTTQRYIRLSGSDLDGVTDTLSIMPKSNCKILKLKQESD